MIEKKVETFQIVLVCDECESPLVKEEPLISTEVTLDIHKYHCYECDKDFESKILNNTINVKEIK